MTAVKVEEQQEVRRQCVFSPEGWCTRKCIHYSTCVRNPHRAVETQEKYLVRGDE